MLSDFLDFIKKHALVEKEDRVLIAVSGGVDSMVLAELFQQAGFDFGIAHCNFQLRGDESEEDERLVEGWAARQGVSFHSKSFNTQEYAKTNGISTQMAARDLRYDWFKDLSASNNYTKLATAHHADDNVETLLLNLIRGTSIAGLRGILPKSNELIRPLLWARRHQIEDFANQEGVVWREDSSNSSEEYKRNFVRRRVMPLLSELNVSYIKTVTKSMSKLAEVEGIFRNYVDSLKLNLVKQIEPGLFSIRINELESNSVGPHILESVLEDFGFNYDQCATILKGMNGMSGTQIRSKDFVMTIDREYLFINSESSELNQVLEISETCQRIEHFHEFQFESLDYGVDLNQGESMAHLDKDKLSFPLTLRKWNEGDRFIPLGMNGKKKVSDFMIDSKIPLNLKNRQEVILSGNDIVWLVGLRIDDRYKVTDQTTTIYRISIQNKNV